MKTETVNVSPMSIADALSLSLGIPAAEIPSRYRANCPAVLAGLETLRGTHPNKVTRWEESILNGMETPKPQASRIEAETVEIPQAETVTPSRRPAVETNFHKMKKVLSVTCQAWATLKPIADLIDDALQGVAPLRPLFLSGFAGLGKSFLAELISKCLPDHRFKEIDSTASVSVLLKAVIELSPYRFIIFIDEGHSMDKDFRTWLKKFTETGGKRKEFTFSIKGEEFTVEIDPTRHVFILATNEAINDTALASGSGRFVDVQLLPLERPGIEQMINHLSSAWLRDTLPASHIKILARNVRPFPRSIKNSLASLKIEVKDGADLSTEEGLKEAIARAGYYPGGWNRKHIEVLKFLAKSANGEQVQAIAAGPLKGMDKKETPCLLAELMQGELISTAGNGRKIATQAGVKLLKSLERK